MLHNPKWESETKPEMFSLESLIAWLETQPASKEYDYFNADKCVLGQWLYAMGCDFVTDKSLEMGETSPFDDIAIYGLPYTFGAALERARAYAAR
jgi:hypothetical protein